MRQFERTSLTMPGIVPGQALETLHQTPLPEALGISGIPQQRPGEAPAAASTVAVQGDRPGLRWTSGTEGNLPGERLTYRARTPYSTVSDGLELIWGPGWGRLADLVDTSAEPAGGDLMMRPNRWSGPVAVLAARESGGERATLQWDPRNGVGIHDTNAQGNPRWRPVPGATTPQTLASATDYFMRVSPDPDPRLRTY